jgi:hypothetical protein
MTDMLNPGDFDLPEVWIKAEPGRSAKLIALAELTERIANEIEATAQTWSTLKNYIHARLIGDDLPQTPFAKVEMDVLEATRRQVDSCIRFSHLFRRLLLELRLSASYLEVSAMIQTTGWLFIADSIIGAAASKELEASQVFEPLRPFFSSHVSLEPMPEFKDLSRIIGALIGAYYDQADDYRKMSRNLYRLGQL